MFQLALSRRPCPALAWLALTMLSGTPTAQAQQKPESVTITGSSDATDRRRLSTTQKTVLDRKEVENLGGLTVGEVIAKLPGIDAGDGGMRARGMVRDSVLILVDGERLAANARMTMAMISRLSSGEIERIEIGRGASAEFGGSAAVTVNLIMRKALAKDSTSMKLSAGVRSGEPNGQLNLSRGGRAGDWSWSLPVSAGLHGSVSERQVTRQNASAGNATLFQIDEERSTTPLPSLSFSPKFTWKRGADSLTLWPTLIAWGGKRDTRVDRATSPDPLAGLAPAADGGRIDRGDDRTGQARLRADGETLVGDSKLTLRTAYSYGRRRATAEHESFPAVGASTFSSESLRRTERDGNAALRLDRGWGEGHTFSGGVEATLHERDDTQTIVTTSRYTAKDAQASLWVQDEWEISKAWILTTGLRGESLRLQVDGSSRRYQRATPSVALRWEPSAAWVWRTSLGAGFKAPKLEELSDLPVTSLSANSPLEPDRRGNGALSPERSVNFEAVVEHYLPAKAGVVGANVYVRRTQNFIERRSVLEGTRWVDRPYNEGSALHWGIELDGKVKTDNWGPKGGTARAHLTLPWSRVDDTRLGLGRPARESPVYQLTLGWDQTLAALKSSFGVQAQLYGAQSSSIPGELDARVNARQVVDIYGLRQITPSLNLRIGLQNLFAADTTRADTAEYGADLWRMGTVARGLRALTVSLEGKW